MTVTEAVRKARIQADAEVPLDDISPDEFGNLWMQVFDRHMAEFGFTYKGVIWNCDCPCLEVFGGGDEEDLLDAVSRYGWSLSEDDKWINEADGDGPLTDEEMWKWLQDKREGDAEDYAEWEARDGD